MPAKELTRNEILEQLKEANEAKTKLVEALKIANARLELLFKEKEGMLKAAMPPSIDSTIVALCIACIRDRMSGSFLEDAEFDYVAKTFVPQAVRLAKMIGEEIAKHEKGMEQ